MPLLQLPNPTPDLAKKLPGMWWLKSREDYTTSGEKRIDPILGPAPMGILCYGPQHFAAQFMRTDRQPTHGQAGPSASNNTQALDGYDAYFGTYLVNESEGTVVHELTGSVVAANVGMKVVRHLRISSEGQLIIQLETTRPDGEPVIRTLIWDRIG